MDHPNIIKLNHAIEDLKQISLIMEYCPHSLFKYLKSQPNYKIQSMSETKYQIMNKFDLRLKLTFQKYFQTNRSRTPILPLKQRGPQGHQVRKHLNEQLKRDKNYRFRLFNCIIVKRETDYLLWDSELCKIIVYFSSASPIQSKMAPEIIAKTAYNGFASDIWSLGILLFALTNGRYPFKGTS